MRELEQQKIENSKSIILKVLSLEELTNLLSRRWSKVIDYLTLLGRQKSIYIILPFPFADLLDGFAEYTGNILLERVEYLENRFQLIFLFCKDYEHMADREKDILDHDMIDRLFAA